MTNAELIAKIKAEIERLMECVGKASRELKDFTPYMDGELSAYEDILDFLSDLEEQAKEVRNPIFDECVANVDAEVMEEVSRNIDIEDELVRYFGKLKDHTLGMHIAIHFAQWGAEHTPLPEDTVLFNKGVEEGKRLMMEEAVEGEVCGRVYDHINVRFADGICKFLEPKNISHIPADVSKYKVGDKVRIIIVKEDEK